MKPPREVKQIIEQLMESPKFKKRWAEHLIQSKWEGWVGERIAQHIRPRNLKNGQLTVIIDEDKWATPFDAFKEKILEKMGKDLGYLSIKGFTMMLDKKRPNPKRQKKRTKEKAQSQNTSKIQSSKPDQSLDKELESELNCIKDPAVRDALKRLIIKSISSNQK